ncbi:MAG: hypothetical protein QOE75_1084 [Solirubrobacterales bacterium]|jgi:hypothetical protein|nr:hypothetical protein [Solirubrobacterales bacterium]
MSNRFNRRRARLACISLAAVFAVAAVPVAAQAAAVNLATAGPFVVLGGSTVTNTGPSVLNGNLGVAPGTSLVGFGLPAVVNGATHVNNGVATQAQADLTTAYNVAAGQPVPPSNNLTGTDLGSRTLTAGNYGFSSSAQLTGALTLDAQGDPNAQFVFEIGSTLTTASASSVILVNGASPCNVYWQIGSSATLDSGTSFAGNLMALTDITLNSGASVIGRVLARNGQISLINNVLGKGNCTTGSSETGTGTGTKNGPGKGNAKGGKGNGAGDGTATLGRGKVGPGGIRATVRGKRIKKVTFSVDGKRVEKSSASSRHVTVPATPGSHVVVANVTFGDGTPPKRMKFRFRIPYPVFAPVEGPSQFTG